MGLALNHMRRHTLASVEWWEGLRRPRRLGIRRLLLLQRAGPAIALDLSAPYRRALCYCVSGQLSSFAIRFLLMGDTHIRSRIHEVAPLYCRTREILRARTHLLGVGILAKTSCIGAPVSSAGFGGRPGPRWPPHPARQRHGD